MDLSDRSCHDLIFDYTLRTVALGSAMLGVVSGVLGAFAVLRRQSLLGDAISHAALPGIALAFLLTGCKAPIGAGRRRHRRRLAGHAAGHAGDHRADAHQAGRALGIVLSVFFGFGLLLLTFIQRLPTAAKAGLDKFLFGQAATLLGQRRDHDGRAGRCWHCWSSPLLWKEFKLLSFDPEFAASAGLPGARARHAAASR